MPYLEVSIYCPHCQQRTAPQKAQIRRETSSVDVKYFPAIWKQNNKAVWWIGVCNYCREPVFVRNGGDIIYPAPLPTPTDQNIPQQIRSDLDEAKLCFSVGAFRACAVMARRAIQTAATDKGASEGKLVGQINELASKGVITKDLKDWATAVRWIGNDAAHPNEDAVSKDDAEAVLKLAEQFLIVVYVTPALARATIESRGKSSNGQGIGSETPAPLDL